jgi:two-component system CheB/CheR fusion protein
MAVDEETRSFETLVDFIRLSRGFDFSGYKRPSLRRRIEKRMQAVHVDSFDAYRRYLDENEDEFIDLFNTILINVTTFFRDGPVWEYLAEEVAPRIIEAARDRDAIRIWSTGCASGEEAFSLAIIFAELTPENIFRDRVKIYATDVDEDALREGRHGIYSASRLDNVSPERRKRFFERVEQRFAVRPEVRRSVIFGRHDVVQDPPISRIDLICSRNTLMYFTEQAQMRILSNFHFALREQGVLLLGKSEMMLGRSNLFEPIDLRRRVFTKIPRVEVYRLPPRRLRQRGPTDVARGGLEDEMREVGFEGAPIAQVVIDRDGNLTLANQRARALFNLAQRDIGRPLKDLEISYRPVELRSQIDRAYAEGHVLNLRNVTWESAPGEQQVMDVRLAPLTSSDDRLVGVGISFVDVTQYKRLQEAVELGKRDVETAYEELQSTVEELETTNEELQSTNEELETTNEELQSTNEELETMNEELQSTNEELEAINDELSLRTEELNQSNTFLESILRSLEAGVIVLDQDLRISAWNVGAFELWGLRGEEVQGEHFMNLDIGLPVEKLHTALRTVLNGGDDHTPLLLDATNRRGRPFTCRVAVTPLHGIADIHGVIVFMEPVEP